MLIATNKYEIGFLIQKREYFDNFIIMLQNVTFRGFSSVSLFL